MIGGSAAARLSGVKKSFETGVQGAFIYQAATVSNWGSVIIKSQVWWKATQNHCAMM